MNETENKIINMIDEMLQIMRHAGDESCSLEVRATRIRKAAQTIDIKSGDRALDVVVEANNWMTYRLNCLKEMIKPGEGFIQSDDAANKYDEFLNKVASLNPELFRKQMVDLVEEMLAEAERLDEIHKAMAIKKMQGEKAIGESWLIFNIKNLRKLIMIYFLKKEKED